MDEQKKTEGQPKYDFSKLPQWIEDAFVVAVDNTVAAEQEIQFHCTRCRESWTCPMLTAEQRREVADLVRRRLINEPMEYFRLAGFTFVAAKRTMLHITMVSGRCHKCGRELPEKSEQAVCRCRSLNLNW